MAERTWTTSEVVAFTERDGPGRPPAAPRRWTALALAGALGVVFTCVLFTDTLCPEHRAWVDSLATVAAMGAVIAVVGLWRDWAGAPVITALTAGLGVSMGLIDTVHSPTRGRFVALAFGVVMVVAALSCTQYVRMWRWDRTLRRELPSPRPVPTATPATPTPATPTPAAPSTRSMLPPPTPGVGDGRGTARRSGVEVVTDS
jgi:hypothetical protein